MGVTMSLRGDGQFDQARWLCDPSQRQKDNNHQCLIAPLLDLQHLRAMLAGPFDMMRDDVCVCLLALHGPGFRRYNAHEHRFLRESFKPLKCLSKKLKNDGDEPMKTFQHQRL